MKWHHITNSCWCMVIEAGFPDTSRGRQKAQTSFFFSFSHSLRFLLLLFFFFFYKRVGRDDGRVWEHQLPGALHSCLQAAITHPSWYVHKASRSVRWVWPTSTVNSQLGFYGTQRKPANKQMSSWTEKRCNAIRWTKKNPIVSIKKPCLLFQLFVTPKSGCVLHCVCLCGAESHRKEALSLTGLLLAIGDYTTPVGTNRLHRTSSSQFAATQKMYTCNSRTWGQTAPRQLYVGSAEAAVKKKEEKKGVKKREICFQLLRHISSV